MNKVAIIHVENSDNLTKFAEFLASEGWTLVSANKTEELLKKQKIPVLHEPALVESNIHMNDNTNFIKQILSSKIPDSSNPIAVDQYSSNIQILCMNVVPALKRLNSVKHRPVAVKPENFFISTIIRSSFTNYENLLILTDPADYKEAMVQIRTDNITPEFRLYLATKALNMISAYDSSISASVLMTSNTSKDFTNYLMFPFQKETNLRAGSNPQQDACLYRFNVGNSPLGNFTKLQGRELDFNYIADISFAWEQISALYFSLKNQFSVKSTNSDGYDFTTQFTPLSEAVFTIAVKLHSIVGASLSTSVLESFKKTNTYDKHNIQGATLACSAVVDGTAAKEIVNYDLTSVVAPGFTSEAKEIFAKNKNIRLIQTTKTSLSPYNLELINDGLIIQTKDSKLFDHWYIKTKNRPSQDKTDQMAFGMLLVSNSRSYSAVLIKDNSITGIAQCATSPEMAIEDAYYEAKRNAQRNKRDSNLADILVCDTAFHFSPILKDIIDAGVTAIIQTGGTSTDNELIQYCNEHNVVVVFTGTTHISY